MTGTIFSANDVSGIPSIEVLDTGMVKLGQYGGNIVLGSGTDDGTNKLQVTGTGYISSTLTVGKPSDLANATLILNAYYQATVEFHKGGVRRWRWNKESSDETGSNAGSNFNLAAHNDDGSTLDYPIQITRAAGGTAAFNREITCTGNITAYFSDERLKDNIKPIENAIAKLKAIRGVTFTSNDFAETVGYKDKKQQVGVIAQEVQKVLPEVISIAPFDNDGMGNSKSGENYLTVKYEKITPLLIEAIKEQQTLIEKLEARLALLEAK
jgi:hypothetical protein